MTTLEEARRCPHCKQPGAPQGTRPLGNRDGHIHIFACMNTRCRWGPQPGDDRGETWLVQQLADGTIPERHKGEKDFPSLSPDQKSMAQRTLEQIRIEEEVERAGLAGKTSVEVDEQAISDDIRRIAGD